MQHIPSLLLTGTLIAGCTVTALASAQGRRPDVILIVTDDQGYGDFGFMGNPAIRTPHLDAMARRSARLSNFYVHPVCTPTRAALMTGRHPQRTRAFDTYAGRAMMDPKENTIAEALHAAGYATGIFGKWHLGDCYPMRPIDQGFDEALVHRGGGIGQPSDPPGAEGKYTDAVLQHNGEPQPTVGYCTDVYFDAALKWIKGNREAGRPFFAFLATNAPHGPFHDVPEKPYGYYSSVDLSPTRFPQTKGHRLPAENDGDRLARIYAMIENIDRNIGRMFEALNELDLAEDTLVLFLVDNGPNTRRYVRGYRGKKTEPYEGGVRSPLLAHWPAGLKPGIASDRIAADYDIMPTILDACSVAIPANLDGVSLLPLLERTQAVWEDRTLFIQAHRGDTPVRYHNCLVRTQRYKLVNASNFHRELDAVKPDFELYDLVEDPFEENDVAATSPKIVAELRAQYDAFFDDVAKSPGIGSPPPIQIGAKVAPRTVLTRQDWKRQAARAEGWGTMGHWIVDVVGAGPFRLESSFYGKAEPHRLELRVGAKSWKSEWPAGQRTHSFDGVSLPKGRQELRVILYTRERKVGAYQVIIQPDRS